MKITNVTLTVLRWPIQTGTYSASMPRFGGEKELCLLTIETDEGIKGHSFGGSYTRGSEMVIDPIMSHVKPMIMGQNALDIGSIWSEMWRLERARHMPAMAIGAVDVALWDIAGKRANLPIHRLLGTCRDKIAAYASSPHYDVPEEYAEEALRYKEEGYTAYKIHPHGIPKVDIEICRTVSTAVGDDMVLMLDPVADYNYVEALRVGRVLEELDYYWYEEPMPESDIYGYVKLCRDLDIPVMATESTPLGLYDMQQYILQGATDILRGDVAVKGGITTMMKIAHLAEAFRMKCEVHHGGNSVNNVANLHCIMAMPNTDYFEMMVPTTMHQYGLVEDIKIDTQGNIHAPTEPGLGYEIDWDLVKGMTTRVLE